MAQLGATFNAQEHDTEQREFSNIPDGDYSLEVEASELKVTKDARDVVIKQTLKLVYRVTEGEYENRKIFGNMNLENPSEEAQKIGQRQLASLCRAVELPTIEDSEELHFRSFRAKVGIGKPSKEKDPDGNPVYPAKSEIKKFYFPDEGEVPASKAAPTKPANDNQASTARQTNNASSAPSKTANDNKPAAAPAGRRPWATKAA